MGDRLKDLTVLVTAVGAPGGEPIIRSLRMNGERRIKIIGTDMDGEVVGRWFCDNFYPVVQGQKGAFADSIRSISAHHSVDVVLPLATEELFQMATNKVRLGEAGTRVAVSDPYPLGIANDKYMLYQFLEREDLAAPVFRIARSFSDWQEAVRDLGYPKKPVCFKPRIGSGSRGYRLLHENFNAMHHFLHAKPDSTVTSYGEMEALLRDADPFPALVVMRFYEGTEYSVDLLIDDYGKVLYSIPRERTVRKLGISNIGRIVKYEILSALAAEIAHKLKLKYNINMQFIDTGAGLRCIEINPRVSGSIIMNVGAGVNLPYFGVKAALGEDIPIVEPDWGMKMFRYWSEVFVDAGYTPTQFRPRPSRCWAKWFR